MPDSGSKLQRWTVVTWAGDNEVLSFVPALGLAPPPAESVEAALAGARLLIQQATGEGAEALNLPTDVAVQTHVVEVEHRELPRLPPELLAAVLTTAIGDVIAIVSADRELLAALLSTLTGLTVQLHDDAAGALDDLDDFEPLTWTEERFQHTVRELLSARLQMTQIPAEERARVLALLEQVIADQLALARELSLDRF